jgi:hypothetical protein
MPPPYRINLVLNLFLSGTAVGKLKKLYDNFDKSSFFDHLVFMIQVPLVNGTSKERPNKYDEKILQVIKTRCE